MRPISRRGLLLGASTAGALAALTACTRAPQTSVTPVPSGPSSMPVPTATSTVPASAFVSGSSCIGAADGQFGRWRGKDLRVAATWVDDGGLVPLKEEFGSWDQSIDYSPQYEFKGRDAFTWQSAAQGTFDDRFRADLKKLRAAWGDRTGFVNYRFQHEFNGDWYPWAATEGTTSAFVAGWRRFADLFHEAMDGDPRFRLSWCVNGGTQSQAVRDIRTLWPGDDFVDVIGVDYYDFFSIKSLADWDKQTGLLDTGGGPIGIGAWQQFAAEHGKPLALPEWGNQYGDNPLFVSVMHEFMDAHKAVQGENAAGALLYEIYFNQVFGNGSPSTKDDFRLQVDGKDNPQRPKAAAEYRRLWGAWPAI